MRVYEGRVIEVQLEEGGRQTVWITCPEAAVPAAGQYLMASADGETGSVLAAPLFPAKISKEAFLVAATVPANWSAGLRLALRGPLGHGFSLPDSASRLALAAMGDTASRLLPLALTGLRKDAAVALFSDCPLPSLPASIEAYPLETLRDSLSWADFLAFDLPLEDLPALRSHLGLEPDEMLHCDAQVLIITCMPCGGAAECGACAFPTRRGWKLACREGPVFDLKEIKW